MPALSSTRLRGWGPFVAGLIAGSAFAAVVVGGILFERPGRAALNRLLITSGVRESPSASYAYHEERLRDAIAAETWQGVVSPNHPDWQVRAGLDLEVHARGFTYPVAIAFVEQPRPGADAPLYYVSELGGTIKYVTRSGSTHVYASGLAEQPIDESANALQYSTEMGLNGLMVVPGTDDLIVVGSYSDEKSGLLKNRVQRLTSADGGRRMVSSRTLLAPDEFTTPAHFVHDVVHGPDGKLYVAFGDAMNARSARIRSYFAGKIVRMNYDGSPCADNPFAGEASATGAEPYVWASGLRNVFGMDFDSASGRLYAIDNGLSFDRLVQAGRGHDFAWDGHNDSTRVGAVLSWGGDRENPGPADIVFLERDMLGPGTRGRAYISVFANPTLEYLRLTTGVGEEVRRIPPKSLTEVSFDPRSGLPVRKDELVLRYTGPTQASVLGLAEGPDGLYFTDFYGGTNDPGHRGAGRVWRVHVSRETEKIAIARAAERNASPVVGRGREAFRNHCMACHRVDGQGGYRGPDLTFAARSLAVRLIMPAYEARSRALLESEADFYVEQRPRILEVLEAEGEERVRPWLDHHLVEPRFDNPLGAMPSFDTLSDGERADIVAYVMTLGGS